MICFQNTTPAGSHSSADRKWARRRVEPKKTLVRGSVFIGAHNGKHADCLKGIGGILRAALHIHRVVIDLAVIRDAVMLHSDEIMLVVPIVVAMKIVERSHLGQQCILSPSLNPSTPSVTKTLPPTNDFRTASFSSRMRAVLSIIQSSARTAPDHQVPENAEEGLARIDCNSAPETSHWQRNC